MSKRIFCCFSIPLKDFLSSQDIKYDVCALNEKTHKTMWLYIKDEKLDIALNLWSLSKPNN